MDPNRFDAFTRRYAAATTRRSALGGLLGGGFLAAFGFANLGAAAPARAAATCTLTWTANVRLGPSAGAMLVNGAAQPGELKGTLTLPLGNDGSIDQGQLILANGSSVTVVGQAVGRALNLRLQSGNGQAFVAVGTAEQAVTSCSGKIDGSLTGPQVGDLGEWHAVASGVTTGSNGAAGGSNGTTTGAGGGTGGAPAAPPTSAAANPTPPSTTNPTATTATGGGTHCASGVICGGVCCTPRAGYTPDQISCDGASCACTYSCQAAGCPYGGTQHSFSVGCEDRPDALCGENCNFNPDTGCGNVTCAPGTTLDPDTCTCK